MAHLRALEQREVLREVPGEPAHWEVSVVDPGR